MCIYSRLSMVIRIANLMIKRCLTTTSQVFKCSQSSFIFKSSIEHKARFSSLPKMKIGTHDGVFHADEVLACYMLKLLPEYKDAQVVRTRDTAILDTLDIVVDVGSVFNHEKKRYDHHQREFKETLSSLRPELGDKYNIKLSSAGLIYTYYGERVLQELAPSGNPLTTENLTVIYKKVYENLIQEVDAIDNGVPMTEEEPKYNISTNLSSRVGKLNPEWNSQETIDIMEQFNKAVALVGAEFNDVVNYYISTWLPARDFVKNALEARLEVHESGEILEFTERCPWKEHLFDLEKEMDMVGKIKYVLFMDKPNSWRVQCVPTSPTSFNTRKPLHRLWWGIRDDLLSEVAEIPDCVFCHSTGFIGGNKTRAGALQMAATSLKAKDYVLVDTIDLEASSKNGTSTAPNEVANA